MQIKPIVGPASVGIIRRSINFMKPVRTDQAPDVGMLRDPAN
jgi:hypothetical protein